MTRPIRVAIVGGGIAGLTAAWQLVKRGFEVRLYEERIYLGGKLGAHRGRVDLRNVRPPAPRRAAAAASGSARSNTASLSSNQESKVRQELDRGSVPDWLQRGAGDHLSMRRQAVRPSAAALSGLTLSADRVGAVAKGALGTAAGKRIKKRQTEETADEPLHRPEVEAQWRAKGPTSDKPVEFDITLHRWNPGTADAAQRDVAIEVSDTVYHEHCYHLFCNWYRNFWALMDQIGLEKCEAFTPHDELFHLFPGSSPIAKRRCTLNRLSAVQTGGDNLLSGAAPVPDLAAWFYSMADLVSQPINPGRYLDQASVHAVLRSGWYATEQSAQFHEFLLAKAFAVPPYLSSAYAYQAYVNYTLTDPDPMLWVLKGNSYNALFRIFEERLRECANFKLALGTAVSKLDKLEERITGFKIRPADLFGSQRDPDDGKAVADSSNDETDPEFVADYVILAVPPAALAELASPLRGDVPGLSSVRKLQSGVTAALDLYFNRKLEGIPESHVVLRGSRYGLTFVDNSQCWEPGDPNIKKREDPHRPGEKFTCLNVAITDFYKIEGLKKPEAIGLVIEDLARFVDFTPDDIDYSRTYLQMNTNEPLFLNEVGSEPWRPGTRTEIPNLFLAGDFCENEIGVVSVEGAVVSGLLAARAVQARAREDSHRQDANRPLKDVAPLWADDQALAPIEVLRPNTYPGVNTTALKLILTPYAVAAKAWARAEEFARYPERALTSRELKASVADMADAPGEMAADWFNFAVEAAQWMAELPYDKNR
jgi:hypothetical protein